jgi:hypothetical protein
VLLTGTIYSPDFSSGDAVVIALRRNGALNATFDHDGIVTTNLGQAVVEPWEVFRVGPRILLTGTSGSGEGTGTNDFTIAAFLPNGKLDPWFGRGGVVRTDLRGRACQHVDCPDADYSDNDQARLFEIAKSNPDWFFAYVAATLDFFCGLRACEIKALQWKHISWQERRLSVRRSKTPASWRDPSLNETCLEALRELHDRARQLGFDAAEHYLFPWHGQRKKLDATRPMTSWRTAWRSLRRAAGLPTVRFHDGRHTALTRLAEKGVPDWSSVPSSATCPRR